MVTLFTICLTLASDPHESLYTAKDLHPGNLISTVAAQCKILPYYITTEYSSFIGRLTH